MTTSMTLTLVWSIQARLRSSSQMCVAVSASIRFDSEQSMRRYPTAQQGVLNLRPARFEAVFGAVSAFGELELTLFLEKTTKTVNDHQPINQLNDPRTQDRRRSARED